MGLFVMHVIQYILMNKYESTEGVREVLPIRGHHLLGTFHQLSNGETPASLTEDRLETFIWQRAELTPEEYATNVATAHFSLGESRSPVYAADRIGFTKDDTEVFADGYHRELTKFTESTDDTPADISAHRDGICNSCFFGNHCQYGQSEELIYMDAFRSVADEVRPGSYTVTRELITNGTSGITMDRIHTNVGTVKEVLTGDKYEKAYSKERRSQNREARRSLRKQAHIIGDIYPST
jgi:hypothetical protein